MKIVAVSQRVDIYPDRRNERRDALDQRLCLWLSDAGYLTVPVPNILCSLSSERHFLQKWLQRIEPNAVVLSGGNDIGDVIDRDDTERILLDYARQMGLPVLGICRGMQMMAISAGGQLVRVQDHVRTRHHLETIRPGWPGIVNSFHNLALAGCPQGFEVTAKSEDGVIEAIRHKSLDWEGWMWHPERESEFQSEDIQRLKALFGK